MVALALLVFPILVILAFNASRQLLPRIGSLQSSAPTRTGVTTFSVPTIHEPILNGTGSSGLNLSLPNIPSVTYKDVLIFIAVIAVALIVIQAIRVMINARRQKPASEIDELIEEREKVAAILDETVRNLSLGSNYRDAVLKCYKLIAETLEAKSSINGKALTANEFRELVSHKLKLESNALTRVTSLFEVARYSKNEVTQENANEAMECLSALSTELKSKKEFVSAS